MNVEKNGVNGQKINKNVINKSKESLYKKYGTESLFNNDEFQKKCRENFKKNMTEFGIVD